MWADCRTLIIAVFASAGLAVGWHAAQKSEPETHEQSPAQVDEFFREPVEKLIARLERDPTNLPVVQRLRVLNDPAAVPALKKAFESAEPGSKRAIAAALLSLGARSGPYFDFLAAPAREAARSDMPYPLPLDARDPSVPKQLNPDFLDWCNERGLEPNMMAQRATFDLPVLFLNLAFARDPRADEIFLQAIDSPNPLIVTNSVIGLALLSDRKAIEPIIRAIRLLPSASRPLPATGLLLFDEPVAQEFARQLIPDEAIRQAYLQAYRDMIPKAAPNR